MDFDTAKENIMPLAGGRDAGCLETLVNAESHHKFLQLLHQQREEYEKAIHEYDGDDPLEPWFNYIQWIEQSYPSGGKENGLFDVLLKCITTFEKEDRYYQDRRMVKLFIKYIDAQSNPQEYYQELYNQGLGTMVADLYICWAYYYDVCGNFAKADEVFRKGLDARAQPLDELEQAHNHFGFSMSQRILHKDEESNAKFLSSMEERRQALTSLRTHKKNVGSIRTGSVIKSHNPGIIEVSGKSSGSTSNVTVKVFDDENHNPNQKELAAVAPIARQIEEAPTPHSVIRSIVDSSRKQENLREPGPWSKAGLNDKRKGNLFGTGDHHHNLGFEIMNDEDADVRAPLPKTDGKFEKGIQLPSNFIPKNNPLPKWEIPIYSDPGDVGANVFSQYEKTVLYPGSKKVFCPEEYRAYRWLKNRGQMNAFTKSRDSVWAPDSNFGIYYYPKFCRKNEPQSEFITERFIVDEDQPSNLEYMFPFKEVYPEKSSEEFSIEEIRCKRIKTGSRELNLNVDETIVMQVDVDETQCVPAALGNDRRSVFFSRKSIAPRISSIPERLQSTSVAAGKNCLSYNNQANSAKTSADDGKVITAQVLGQQASGKNCSSYDNQVYSTSLSADGEKAIAPQLLSQQAIQDNTSQLPNPQIGSEGELEATTQKIRDFVIFEDTETMPKECAPENKFGIFEDPDDKNSAVFKVPQGLPQGVIRSLKPRMSVFPTGGDEEEEKPGLFGGNETCSTQTFNLFIKAQSVSTPKNSRKSQSHLVHQEERLPRVESLSPPTPPIESDVLSSTEANVQFLPKQLSIIMETTETNTGSSGTTKSSAETQDLDTDSMKSNQTTKVLNPEMVRVLDPILEVSALQKTVQPETFHATRAASSIIKPAHQEDSPAMLSMKIFEDKTETVPRTLLVKPQVQLPSNDNFDILFTTTPPPKNAFKINSSALNESITFTKLSEITLPKMKGENSIQNDQYTRVQGNIEEKSRTVGTGTIAKKIEVQAQDIYEINDSMTFSNLKNFTLSNLMEKSQNAKPVKNERDLKVFMDSSVHEKSPMQLFMNSGFADQGAKCGEIDFNVDALKVNDSGLLVPMSLKSHEMLSENMLPSSNVINTLQKDTSLGNASASKSTTLKKPPALVTSQIQEKSFHIKEESGEDFARTSHTRNSSNSNDKCILSRFSAIAHRGSKNEPVSDAACNIAKVESRSPTIPMNDRSVVWYQETNTKSSAGTGPKSECNDLGRSIYIKASPKTPTYQRHYWVDDSEDFNTDNNFVHDDIDLNQTKQLIEAKIDDRVNPFDRELIKAFLDQIEICSYLQKLPTCLMVNRVQAMQKGSVISVSDKKFDIVKLVGEGSYGSVFCAKELLSGKLYAVKQERPANLWEYYICLELDARISGNMISGFMDVNYAVIGNNASLLISEYAKYGSLINVCHKFHAATGKNIDEYVVMVLANQLLSIIDHLHAANIIHADIKPDNFLLMSKLSYPWKMPCVQLIDFGVSIDLRLFPPKQRFTYVVGTQGFSCIEMLEKRPWTYQPDLFGLAGTIHALLFGKYMDVVQKASSWGIKTHMPRYFNKTLWNTIFNTLLNIRDCESMPNLQYLRSLLEEEIVEKEKLVREKLNEFNLAIDSK